MSIDWDARIEEALTEQPHLRRVRCRCKGCQGPPSCRCCVELHLFPMDVPDDTELSQPDDQSVIHWHDRAVAAEAALAESTARADRLAAEVSELRAAGDAMAEAIRFGIASGAAFRDCNESACEHPWCAVLRARERWLRALGVVGEE